MSPNACRRVSLISETRIDFLYLNEPDMIAAGVTDMARCVDVMEETLVLLRRGDFRMAGANAMSHGAMISFPKEPEFENMPADGPDRRFMAMPAYLGGMPVEDIAWATEVYRNTVDKGIGTKLNLWDAPNLA